MDQAILEIIKTVGIPVALIVYYLFIELPKQREIKQSEETRYDNLVAKVLDGQKQCAESIKEALAANNTVIKELEEVIKNKL